MDGQSKKRSKEGVDTAFLRIYESDVMHTYNDATHIYIYNAGSLSDTHTLNLENRLSR
jgi:hypothetical protein